MDLFLPCCCFSPVVVGTVVAWMCTRRPYPKIARFLLGCLVCYAVIGFLGFATEMYYSSRDIVAPACDGDIARVRDLIRSGGNPNIASDGLTAIDCAATNGHWEVVRVLLAAGADPNPEGDFGPSPLEAAKADHQESIVRLLIAAGARQDRRQH